MSVSNEVLLDVQGLQKAYGSNQVLNGITTQIRRGEVVAIIGPSGCGKSTFLRSLNLLEEPTGGKILFEGTDITDPKVDINRHRQKIGMVFQQFNLFPHKTVKEYHAGTGNFEADEQRRSREKSSGASQACRTSGQGRFLSGHAFRWTEAAYRHCKIPCHEPGCDAV